MSTRQSKPRSLSPKCCQMHKTENYTQVQIWCKKVHFTFHQILTNCIFLSEARHVWYPAAEWCIGAPKKRSIVFHFTALTTWTSLSSKQCSLVQWLVPFWCWCTVEWKGRGRLLVWNTLLVCSTYMCSTLHTAGVKLPGFAALRTHFARDRFNLCSLALIGESLISFCQSSLAIRSRFPEKQKRTWDWRAEFSRNLTRIVSPYIGLCWRTPWPSVRTWSRNDAAQSPVSCPRLCRTFRDLPAPERNLVNILV